MILLIDNYDSFVFNLARYIAELGADIIVRRNDAITLPQIQLLQPAAIILSPGPCSPAESGICPQVVRELSHGIPMLGVCLGHQVIAAAFGAAVDRAPEPVHGRTSLIQHDGSGLFHELPNPFRATRYHSLTAISSTIPSVLRVTARTVDGLVMAVEHCRRPVYGVQFHPESVLTEHGHLLLRNFLNLAGLQLPSRSGSGIQPVTTCALTTMHAGPQTQRGEDGFRDDRSISDRPLHW